MLRERPQFEHRTDFATLRNDFKTQGETVVGVGGRFQASKGKFAEIFPCSDPVNPHFSDYFKRLDSFQSAAWHAQRFTPKPEHLAAAGLFYLGDKDRCKCYYCNGGLQNWEDGDDPMIEHAKYFPQCEFVLQHKGPDFVANLNAEFPNISRPGISSNASQSQQTVNFNPPTRNNSANFQQDSERSPISRSQNGPPAEALHRLEKDLMKQAEEFGFAKELIKRVVDRKHMLSGTSFESLGALINELQLSEMTAQDPINERRMDACGLHSANHISQGLRPRIQVDGIHQIDLKNQLQSALDESVCVMCYEEERSCLFMNCGHLCCCYECGKNVRQCPVCKCNVVQTIRIFKT